MLTIFLIRHGETDYNRNGIVQGGGIDSSLNDKGREQAQAFYETYKHHRFDALYCSGLKRTWETLQPWMNAGYTCTKVSGINELSWGVQEGTKPSKEAISAFRQIIENWKNGNLDEKIEEGESPNEGWARAEPFFEMLRTKHYGQKILICSHGRQMRIMLSMVLGYGLIHMEHFSSHNTALSLLHLYENGRAFAEKINDTSHLKR